LNSPLTFRGELPGYLKCIQDAEELVDIQEWPETLGISRENRGCAVTTSKIGRNSEAFPKRALAEPKLADLHWNRPTFVLPEAAARTGKKRD
jgi:hypothetical protein